MKNEESFSPRCIIAVQEPQPNTRDCSLSSLPLKSTFFGRPSFVSQTSCSGYGSNADPSFDVRQELSIREFYSKSSRLCFASFPEHHPPSGNRATRGAWCCGEGSIVRDCTCYHVLHAGSEHQDDAIATCQRATRHFRSRKSTES